MSGSPVDPPTGDAPLDLCDSPPLIDLDDDADPPPVPPAAAPSVELLGPDSSEVKTLFGQVAALWPSAVCADVVAHLGSEESEIQVHSAILAARSQVFREMFQQRGAERGVERGVVSMTEWDVDTGTSFFLYLYTGSIASDVVASFRRLEALLKMGLAYRVTPLVARVTAELTSDEHMTVERCVDLLKLAQRHAAERDTAELAAPGLCAASRDAAPLSVLARRATESNKRLPMYSALI
eukprot:Selendium_serpulae@DN5028_c0_g1_i1.p1